MEEVAARRNHPRGNYVPRCAPPSRLPCAAMTRTRLPLLIAAAALLVAAPLALAAPKNGSYKGTSKGTIEVMVPDPVLFKKFVKQTDTGKVSFSVKGGVVKSFSIKGQKLMCGGQPLEADVKISSITLNAKGSGTGTKTLAGLGPMKVTIKVTAKGAASGTVKSAGNICASSATFKASPS